MVMDTMVTDMAMDMAMAIIMERGRLTRRPIMDTMVTAMATDTGMATGMATMDTMAKHGLSSIKILVFNNF